LLYTGIFNMNILIRKQIEKKICVDSIKL
jgi:hypothetical protein